MLVALIVILAVTAALPLLVKSVEENIEFFILAMGVIAAEIGGELNGSELHVIFTDVYPYLAAGTVLAFNAAFMYLDVGIAKYAELALNRLRMWATVFVIIVATGLLSCVISSIVAGLLLAELVALLPLNRRKAVAVNIIACFAIGIGSILTPLGGPFSAIVASGLKAGFGFLFAALWPYVVPAVLLLGIAGAAVAHRRDPDGPEHASFVLEKHSLSTVLMRAGRIFVFIVGLELLGAAFRPVVERYVIHWGNAPLYAVNTLSAVLDNSTMAAAEISPALPEPKFMYILFSLMVSGGMMITGNIPNIVTSGRLKIGVREWLKRGLPIGAVILAGYLLVLGAVYGF